MAAKKRPKKTAKSTTANKKTMRGKRVAAKRKPSKKKKVQRKAAARTSKASRKALRKKRGTVDSQFSVPAREPAQSRGQSGDLQGLSDVAQADSESVDELLDEGNPFGASVVSGVEGAADADEREVHTREVPEDDVPDEYLDNDK